MVNYECPNCGSSMTFNGDTGEIACSSCSFSCSVADYNSGEIYIDNETDDDTADSIKEMEFSNVDTKTSAGEFSSDDVKEYNCNNCGAILVTNNDTTATICNFCNSPMILSDRLSGHLAPSKVIPFSISKQRAEESFRKWCRGGFITPKGFLSAERIKSVQGIYVPFWLFDMCGQGEFQAKCTKTKTYTRGDNIITETRHYQVYRKVESNYYKIPADASIKMDDNLMDSLEPFNYEKLESFDFAYLSGFVAEKYNYTDKDLFDRVKSRISKFIEQYAKTTINGYDTQNITKSTVNARQIDAVYTLLPVYMVNYDYNGKTYTFAMNGQTGKIAGEVPVSIPKCVLWFLGTYAISFIILYIINSLL